MQTGYEVMHLLSGSERTFVQNVETPLAGVGLLPLGKMKLQRGGFDAGFAQFLSCPAGRRKGFHLVAACLGSLADDGKRGGLPRPGYAVQSDDLFLAGKDLFGCFVLGIVQLRMVTEQLGPVLRSKESRLALQGEIAVLRRRAPARK